MKPGIPKGTRDFTPSEMLRRNWIFDNIRTVFRLYGYEPIETPAMENLSTLEGKYGEEGDKLLFRILNSGDPFAKTREAGKDIKISDVAEKGLRYDLTVPFTRYVVMHQNDITFPFKRYQIQAVWRADRPQKGRYREFFQCDADVIGSNSLLNEVELLRIIAEVFRRLDLGICIKLNNRKILSGIAEVIGQADKIIDITVAIDKLDKIGLEKVNEELISKGLSTASVEKLQPIIQLSGSNSEKLDALRKVLADSSIGLKGIEETEEILETLGTLATAKDQAELDITLARGLNYYTGAIIEVKVEDKRSSFHSSICGGGRYDDLTGIFGLPAMSGVGISFGADRIYDVLDEVKGFPDLSKVSTRILFANFGKEEAASSLRIVEHLRAQDIAAELYPDAAKMKKQFSYADNKQIPFVGIIGSEEMKSGMITVKNMASGEQSLLNTEQLIALIN